MTLEISFHFEGEKEEKFIAAVLVSLSPHSTLGDESAFHAFTDYLRTIDTSQ